MSARFRSVCDSPLGQLTIVSDGQNVLGLFMAGQRFVSDDGLLRPDLILHQRVYEWLDAYFAGQCPNPHQLPLAPSASAFGAKVLELLCTIPYGATTTYGAIARQLSTQEHRVSARAVGWAVGRNPISIIIPCHRVIGSDGSLTGYAGGIERKQMLLQHESGVKLLDKDSHRC